MAWTDAYLAYDDDTLAALANPGLLRRAAKDVEAGKVHWHRQGDADGVVEADGQQVQLDARGPQQARCNCPAPGICKHILGAALWLRALPAQPAEAPAPATTLATAAPADTALAHPLDPLVEILALDEAMLFKAAGVAAQRRAVQSLPCGVEWRVQGSALVMDLPELGCQCRWVAGAGWEGMVSEVPARERKAVHLLALAAVRAAVGQPLVWPPGLAPAPAATPQEGDNEVPPLGASERAFVAQVQALLHELLMGGLSHVSTQTSARLLALNMSARGEGLPRLAALLRNLGGLVDGLVRRDHRTLERDALALMARTHALCEALVAPSVPTRTLASLRGRLRRDFDDAAALELLPLGGHWWQTPGGARGLTLAFWDLQAQRLVQAAVARPDGSDPGFTRHSAWNLHALWPGAGAAASAMASPWRLEHPRLAEDGRLALGGRTRAAALEAWRAADPRLTQIGCACWADLNQPLQAAAGLAGEAVDLLLLRPSSTQAPVLDEARQQSHWPVQDSKGHWLRLTIPVAEDTAQRLENLERLTGRQAPVHAVLVRVERTAAQTLLVPVAVLSSGVSAAAVGDVVVPVSLDFASEPRQATPLGQRILRLLQSRKEQAVAPAMLQPTLAMRLLAPVLGALETQAATGRMPLPAYLREPLEQARPSLAAVGLRALEAALDSHLQHPTPSSLLRLACLAQWAVELDSLPSMA